MLKRDYSSVAYKILEYLKKCYENGEQVDSQIFNSETYKISQNQFVQTLKMLEKDGYIEDVTPVYGKTSILYLASITSSGLQYLSENSMIKRTFKIIRWLWNTFLVLLKLK